MTEKQLIDLNAKPHITGLRELVKLVETVEGADNLERRLKSLLKEVQDKKVVVKRNN